MLCCLFSFTFSATGDIIDSTKHDRRGSHGTGTEENGMVGRLNALFGGSG
jgi:hypothetical protein